MIPSWHDRAACAGMDTEVFFPPGDSGITDEARAACESCPVRQECGSYAMTRPEKFGTWGGMSMAVRETERRKLMRRGLLREVAA